MSWLGMVKWGLPVEAAEGNVLDIAVIFLAICLKSARDLQGGSHRLQVRKEWSLSCILNAIAGDRQLGLLVEAAEEAVKCMGYIF